MARSVAPFTQPNQQSKPVGIAAVKSVHRNRGLPFSKMASEKILVLGNYKQTLTVVRSLTSSGSKVLIGRHGPRTFTEFSRCASEIWIHPDPAARTRFLCALVELLRSRQDIGYVFPVGEMELDVLASGYRELRPLAGLVMPFPDLARTCFDKPRMYEIVDDLGIPVPETRLVGNSFELVPAVHELGFPLVIKRPNSFQLVTGQKALICHTKRHFQEHGRALANEKGRFLVQRWVEGDRHNCQFAALRGKIIAFFQQKVLRTDESDGTGFGVYGISVPPTCELRRFCELLVGRLRYSGVGCIQFLVRDRPFKAAFLEINPRLDATCALPYLCGFDFPNLALRCVSQREDPEGADRIRIPSSYPEGKRYYWLYGDLRALRRALRTEKSRAELIRWLMKVGVSHWRAHYHLTWSWSDPMPSLFLYWRAIRTALSGRAGLLTNNAV